MPRQVPKVGDVFLVELDDGTFAVGQVLETRPVLMISFTCAFFDQRVKSAYTITFPLIRSSVLSCQFVTRDAFNRGKWTRVRSEAVQVSESDLPYRETEQSGWIGAKVIGTGLMTGFLNAYFGLRSWNEMKNPKYYESLLFGRRPPPIAVS